MRAGENILIGQDGPAFARAVIDLLTDNTLNRRLRLAGRRWVEAHYAWPAVYRQLDQVYAGLLRDDR